MAQSIGPTAGQEDQPLRLEIGDKFGGPRGDRFVIERQLGVGGQGIVFAARDSRLDRLVALKVSTATGAQKALFLERFERELRLSSRINHPHVLQTYDCGELDSGHPYVLLEYAERGSLVDLVNKTRKSGRHIPLAYVQYYAGCLASALKAAHAGEMVHRDVKPDNMLIVSDGVAKLTDFGIAKDISPEAIPLTEVGSTMGTLGFMAPEQLSGLPGPQSDIFSFGVTVYAVMTSAIPKQATQNSIPLGMVLEEAWEKIPDSWVPFLKRCTAPKLDDRYETFDEVLEGLAKLDTNDPRPQLAAGELPPLPSTVFGTAPEASGNFAAPNASVDVSSSADSMAETADMTVMQSARGMPARGGGAPAPAADPNATVAMGQVPMDDDFGSSSGGGKGKLLAVVAAVLLLGGGGAVVALNGAGGPPSEAEVLTALRAFEAAARTGDYKAAGAAAQKLPATALETPGGKLVGAYDALYKGDNNKARTLAAGVVTESGELGARASLITAAAMRLGSADGYNDAVTSYSKALACTAPACDTLRKEAQLAINEACLVLGPTASGCAGKVPDLGEREAQLARSAVLLGDGHEDRGQLALIAALNVHLGRRERPGCLENAVLQKWALEGSLSGNLKTQVWEAGRDASRSAEDCQSFE